MARAGGRKFTGCAQDYLDWFKGTEFDKVMLPNSQTDGEGLPAPEAEECQLPPLPLYMRRNEGCAYADEYQKEILQTQEMQCSSDETIQKGQKLGLMAMEESTVTGKMSDDDDDDDDLDAQKTQVYLHYDFSVKDQHSTLPVFDARKEILAKIANYQVVVIEGETGCGKSTQVPQFILDEAVEKHRHCNIVVTQPRKIAATSLARRVCKERGWPLGKLVGYQVGLDDCTDLDTRLSFVTTEVLVQKLIHQRSLQRYTHIILDEVHERDQHTDFALLVVKKLLRTISPNVKIILMSATIDAIKFAHYFATPVMGHLLPAPIVSAGENTIHKVQIFYLESLSVICKERPNVIPQLPSINQEVPGISEDMYKLATEMVKCFDYIERQEEGLKFTEFSKKRGAVLVFLPGLVEIEQFMDFLSKESSKYQWQLFPLHSTITQEEQQQVFCIPPPCFRKVILSTNIAESSITVPDIKYVIDFCLTKVVSRDIVTNYTSLKLAWTSKASCKQRAGRSGRVSSGRVYRLIPQIFFENLPAYATPELCRTPLTHVILKTKVLNMGEPHSLLALALDPPKMADIHRTILVLKQMGALAVKSNGQMSILDGDLTYLGRVVANLPVDPHLAKLIVMGYLFGCLEECIIIAAGLSLKSFHARPFQDELNAFLSKVSWSYGSFSDCLAILNTYNLWQSMQVRGEFMRPGGKQEKAWAKRSYVQLSILQEVQKLVKELTQRLEKLKITVRNRQNPPRHNQSLILKICMAAAFFPHYYKRNISEDYERETCRELNGHDPFTTVVLGGLPADTNILYDHQIRQLFKECSQNLIIHYEGSKAYIQFPRLGGSSNKEEHFQDIPGECPTSMYLALKMRQVKRIQQGLVLTLYSQEESKAKMMETLGYSTDPSGSVSVSSNTSSQQTLSNTRLRATQPSFCRLKPPVLPAPTNHTWRVHVTYVKSAGHFWVVSSEKNAVADLHHVQSSIELALNNNQAPLMAQKHIIPGNVCLAKYTDIDGMQAYYRARIEEVYDCQTDIVKAMVFFVDFGNNEVVNTLDLRCLPESIMDMNMLAVECMLAELKPASKSADGTWGLGATDWFQGYTLNKDFTVQIYSVVHGIIRVKLLGMDKGRLISVNHMLISMGFAVKAEEFYMSKQNHELRAIYSNEIEESAVRDDNLTSAFSSLSFNFPSGPSSFSGKARLRGPDSPLLMRFVALNRPGGFKSVKIEPSSVNSTALDLEPQNLHDRLLLASCVTLDASESSVTLRNTTLMPSIPGILSLCLLLFCPIAELRVNREGTHYTGALVGLGCEDKNGHAIYPHDDTEIEFDIAFSQDDLIMINKIRFLMDAVLEEGEDVTDKMLIHTQKRLREFIIGLLDEKREYKEPKSFHRPYHWQMVPEEDLLNPVTSGALDDASLVFPLLNGIFLRPDNYYNELLRKHTDLKDLLKRLAASGTLPYTKVNVTCPLCDESIYSFMDLQMHFASTAHEENELHIHRYTS